MPFLTSRTAVAPIDFKVSLSTLLLSAKETRNLVAQAVTSSILLSPPRALIINKERLEFDSADYDQAITDLANSKWNEQQFGYIQARQEGYGSIADQLDMQYWDAVNGTTTWQDHIAQVKTDNPKPE